MEEDLLKLLPKTVQVRKSVMVLICLALFVLAGLVGMYFYQYGLPVPIEKGEITVTQEKQILGKEDVSEKDREKDLFLN